MSGGATADGAHRAASWSPGTVWPTVQIALGIVAVVAGVSTGDPLGLLLTGLLALLLIPAGALQLLRRPRIEVVDGLLAVKKLGGVLFVPPAQMVGQQQVVQRLQVMVTPEQRRRWGCGCQ